MTGFIGVILLLIIGGFFGAMNERRHIRRVDVEERALSHIAVYNLKTLPAGYETEPDSLLVTGSVVIAFDYLKQFIFGLRNLIGGHIPGYEKLIMRARREALVRMLRQADEAGADAVFNVRLEFSNLGEFNPKAGGAELFAYGTAVKRAE